MRKKVRKITENIQTQILQISNVATNSTHKYYRNVLIRNSGTRLTHWKFQGGVYASNIMHKIFYPEKRVPIYFAIMEIS